MKADTRGQGGMAPQFLEQQKQVHFKQIHNQGSRQVFEREYVAFPFRGVPVGKPVKFHLSDHPNNFFARTLPD